MHSYIITLLILLLSSVKGQATGANYVKMNDGQRCANGRITDESTCIQAASALGYVYSNSWNGPTDVVGCIHANDGRNKMYFNTALTATGHNPRYAEVCVNGYVIITSGTCTSKGYFDVMDTDECKNAAVAVGLVSSSAQKPARQSENDRPHGCRRQTFGQPLWINDKVNSPTEASTTHSVVCSTVNTNDYYYLKMNDGESCSDGRITGESACIQAAAALGYVYSNSWYGPTDVVGCIHANDGRNKMYFNTALTATGHNPRYAEVCAKDRYQYAKMNDGEACTGGRITIESSCIKAAAALGYVYSNSWYGPTDVVGCVHANDGRNKMYFNTALTATGHNPRYAEVCEKETTAFLEDCRWESNHDQNPNSADYMGWTCADDEILTGFGLSADQHDVTKVQCCKVGGHSAIKSNTCTYVESNHERAKCGSGNDHKVFSGAYDKRAASNDAVTEILAGKCCEVECDSAWCAGGSWGVDKNNCQVISTASTNAQELVCPKGTLMTEVEDGLAGNAHGVQKVASITCCALDVVAPPTQAPSKAPTTSRPTSAPTAAPSTSMPSVAPTTVDDCLLSLRNSQLTDSQYLSSVDQCLPGCRSTPQRRALESRLLSENNRRQ